MLNSSSKMLRTDTRISEYPMDETETNGDVARDQGTRAMIDN